MSNLTNSNTSPNAISSPGSEAGLTPSGSQDGPTTAPSGQVPAPVSRSAPPESAKESKTSDTCGPCSSTSSRSAALTSALASRLRQLLDTVGCVEYKQTWNEKTTPSGRSYWAHTASVRRTSDSDCIGLPVDAWATPTAHKLTPQSRDNRCLARDALVAAWPTPCQQDGPNGGPSQGTDRLPGAVSMAGWYTPSARDWKDTPGMSETGTNPDGSTRTRLDQLPRQAGLTASGTPAETAKRGVFRLNPLFSLWLMGFPPREWASCAELAMQSCHKLRQRLSKRGWWLE